ncbi:MFS transporter [Ochrobactrum pseudogrignonense]|nr:MFS transporter [Brucella pseudogrignonensis]
MDTSIGKGLAALCCAGTPSSAILILMSCAVSAVQDKAYCENSGALNVDLEPRSCPAISDRASQHDRDPVFGFAGRPQRHISRLSASASSASDFTYSVVAFCAVVANLAASIAIGLVSDRIGRYRAPMVIVTALGIAGFGLIWLFPSPWVFALATIGPIALFNVISTLLLPISAITRLEWHRLNSAIRSPLFAWRFRSRGFSFPALSVPCWPEPARL